MQLGHKRGKTVSINDEFILLVFSSDKNVIIVSQSDENNTKIRQNCIIPEEIRHFRRQR